MVVARLHEHGCLHLIYYCVRTMRTRLRRVPNRGLGETLAIISGALSSVLYLVPVQKCLHQYGPTGTKVQSSTSATRVKYKKTNTVCVCARESAGT